MQQIEEVAKEYSIHMFGEVRGDIIAALVKGGLKGMEIQKEIDRQEIERLKNEIQMLRNIAKI